jgi:hypothetical protein
LFAERCHDGRLVGLEGLCAETNVNRAHELTSKTKTGVPS